MGEEGLDEFDLDSVEEECEGFEPHCEGLIAEAQRDIEGDKCDEMIRFIPAHFDWLDGERCGRKVLNGNE